MLTPAMSWRKRRVNGLRFFCLIEQLRCRTSDLPLLTISAGQLSPHECISQETQEEQGDDENEDGPGKSPDQEEYSCKNGNNEQEKIRENIFPRDLHRGELLRAAFFEKQGTQPAFAKRTGFTVIVTVPAVSADQPELKDKDENEIDDGPDDAGLKENVCTGPVDQER